MTPIRVIKIGGSLLQRDKLLADLRCWRDSLADPLINIWIVGGGTAVDAIRKHDQRKTLSETDAHWSSIEAMDANASTLASRMPDWQITNDPNEPLKAADVVNSGVADTMPPQNFALQTQGWLTDADNDPNSQPRLPHCWDVTSDSIAAWAAIQLHATELVLLKSCDVPDKTIAELAGLQIVDAYLPSLDLDQQNIRFTCQQLPHSTS